MLLVLKRCCVVLVALALLAGCAGKGYGPERTRLAAALLVREAQLQFRQAASIFDAFCDVPASSLSASELSQCSEWIQVVAKYKIAYPLALAAVQAPTGLDLGDPTTLDALLKVKNEIIRLLIFRNVEPAIVTPTLGSACSPFERDDPQAPRGCRHNPYAPYASYDDWLRQDLPLFTGERS